MPDQWGFTAADYRDLEREKRLLTPTDKRDLIRLRQEFRRKRTMAVGAPTEDQTLTGTAGTPSRTYPQSDRSMIPAGTSSRSGVGMGDVRKVDRGVGGDLQTDSMPSDAPSQDELRRVATMRRRQALESGGTERIARAVAGGYDPSGAASIAARGLAEFDADQERRKVIEANRALGLSPTGQTYQSPQKVIANRAELNRQLQANTGATGGRVPPSMTPVPDPMTFFLGNGAERYQGAGETMMRLRGANQNRQALNADQNTPRGPINFGEYTVPGAGGMGSPDMLGSVTSDVADLRRASALRSRRMTEADTFEQSEAARAIAEARAGAAEADTRRIVATTQGEYAPRMAESELGQKSDEAEIARITTRRALEEARRASAPSARAVGDPGTMLTDSLARAESLVSGADSALPLDFNDRLTDFMTGTVEPLESLAQDDPVQARKIAAAILPKLQMPMFSVGNVFRQGRPNPLAYGIGAVRSRLEAIARTPIQ